MLKFISKSAAFALLTMAVSANAFTSDELFSTAMSKGVAKGVLTGEVSDRLKKETHSVEPTQAILEKGTLTPEGCQTFKFTLNQPKVPLRQGGFAGDYVTVTKVVSCKGGVSPQPVVLDCSVGGVSCMPHQR